MNRRDGARSWLVPSVARACYRTGVLRGFNFLANRLEGYPSFPFVRRREHRNVQILIYHRVLPAQDDYLPATPLDAFGEQMETLARHFRVCSLSEAVSALERGQVAENTVVLTFDDGYRDNWTHAFPVLDALSLPATIFLVSGAIGGTGLLWHDRAFRALRRAGRPELSDFGPGRSSFRLDGPGRDEAWSRVLATLRSREPAERDRLVEELERRLGVEPPDGAERVMLDWNEVRAMHRRGIDFGAHTVSHPILSGLALDEARREIVESRRRIEAELGAPVECFAYPNGRREDWGEAIARLVREAGYRCAVTTVFGTNSPGTAEAPLDLWTLRREGGLDGDPAVFAAKMNLYKFCA